VIGAQLLLALLAPCAVLGSEMPRMAAWPLATVACAYGLWLARREARKPARQLLWPAADAPVVLDGEPLQQAELHWRGPLAFLRWRGHGGRGGRLGWWPDTLPPAQRRELRLAARARAAAQPAASMAP
jgi:toxin CptA